MRDGFRSYTKSGATNGVVMYESAVESCDDGYCYEPVPGWNEPVDWNTEDYNPVKESGFLSVFTSPFSTFGADVDTATYTNLRRSIFENDGFGIDETAIRIEEMINYFH
ncbi:MAG: von Willebrand factor type A domain-containing protein, partial [Eubacterium sp.]|nr:von Willebrand factor type A domain-containing protein [Eubacterium sp.]